MKPKVQSECLLTLSLVMSFPVPNSLALLSTPNRNTLERGSALTLKVAFWPGFTSDLLNARDTCEINEDEWIALPKNQHAPKLLIFPFRIALLRLTRGEHIVARHVHKIHQFCLLSTVLCPEL